MSLTNEQNNFLRCICDVLGFEHPDNLSDEQEEALLDCFKTLTTTKEKTKTKTKTKADTKTKQGKPGNVWITWLQLNRDAIKSENGGENGLVAILSERYAVFKKTSAFKKLQEKCKEKMEEYKSDKSAAEDSDDDDEPKAKKAKKAIQIKTLVLKPQMTDKEIEAKEGTYFDGKNFQIIDQDADVYGLVNGQKQLLAKFRKNVFPKDTTDLGWESFYRAAAASRSRGAAAGPIKAKSKYWKTRKLVETNGWWARYKSGNKTSKMRVNNPVFSSVVGYFEATPFMKLPCRLTTYTQNYFEDYKKGLPFIEAIDKEFKHLVPQAHAKQYKRIHGTPTYQIKDTAFSSVTINRNFRTALHKDAGDFKDGYGNLTVLERGKYHGAKLSFPSLAWGST